MTTAKAISAFDALRHNDISDSTKTEWITELDKRVFSELLSDYAPADKRTYAEYSGSAAQLLAPEGYCDIYVLYLIMKYDELNGESARFNNSASLFNKAWYEMANFVSRTALKPDPAKIKAGDIYV